MITEKIGNTSREVVLMAKTRRLRKPRFTLKNGRLEAWDVRGGKRIWLGEGFGPHWVIAAKRLTNALRAEGKVV